MKILVAGDFVPSQRIATQIEQGNYRCLDNVKPIIQTVDYAIVNFESPVVTHPDVKPIEKTGPSLKCSGKAMECVAQAGFHCVTLANNHFRDFGDVGVVDTLQACVLNNVDYVGGGKNIAEAEKILYKKINGQILAVINLCENEWSIASENRGGAAPLNIIRNYYAIQDAKKIADVVLVIVHGGHEFYQLPSPRMVNTYRFFIDAGADAVVNHHQHCYSGYEVYNGKPIFYGLGNFCFDKNVGKNELLWIHGYLLELQINDTINFCLYPYKQCDENLASIHMLKNRNWFDIELQKLNLIISDSHQLQYNFELFELKEEGKAKNILVPYSNIILKKISDKGFLPSFITKNRVKKLLAYVQCESHRDILLFDLSMLINKGGD